MVEGRRISSFLISNDCWYCDDGKTKQLKTIFRYANHIEIDVRTIFEDRNCCPYQTMSKQFFKYVPERLQQSCIVLVHDINVEATEKYYVSAFIKSKADA